MKTTFTYRVIVLLIVGYGLSPFASALSFSSLALGQFSASPSAPISQLLAGGDGYLYGTSSSGGAAGQGSVFQMTLSGSLKTFASFSGANDYLPWAGIIRGLDGNFYGTTYLGGAVNSGTVYSVDPSGTISLLVNFDGVHGANPECRLVQATDGNFYGTTLYGGGSGDGVIFKVTPAGKLSTLLNFNGSNGANPGCGLVQGSDGNLYGCTEKGGTSGLGTIFRVTLGGTLTTLLNFNQSNGSIPLSDLIQGTDGNFYGATEAGGITNNGTIFKVSPQGTLTTLFSFNGGNGSAPVGRLIQAADGNFYGVTGVGGPANDGTVFSISPSGTFTNLYSFGGEDGVYPSAGLCETTPGRFFGTTMTGGIYSTGAVYELDTNPQHNFTFNSASTIPLQTNLYIISGESLSLTLNFAPAPGTVLTAIHNLAYSPIFGRFSNLPDGGTISATYLGTTYTFTANYSAGSGYDLTLTLTGTSPAVPVSVLHITGSESFRVATNNAIVNYLSSLNASTYGVASNIVYGGSLGLSSISQSDQAIYETVDGANNWYVVETSFTNSGQGIHDTALASNPSVSVPGAGWIMSQDPAVQSNLTVVLPASAPSTISGGTNLTSASMDNATSPDATLSDVWQATTLFSQPTVPAINEVIPGGVGVLPLVICASKGAPRLLAGVGAMSTTVDSYSASIAPSIATQLLPGYNIGSTNNISPFTTVATVNGSTGQVTLSLPAVGSGVSYPYCYYPGLTNISDEQIQALFNFSRGVGTLPLSQFTGVPADATRTVMGILGIPGSGIRCCFTAQTGIGNEQSASQLYQDYPVDGSNQAVTTSNARIVALASSPTTVYNGLTLSAGDYGFYTSPTQIAAVLQNNSAARFGYSFVSPLSIADATSAITGGATALTYNGQYYGRVSVENGAYALWSYEHLYQSAALTGAPLALAQGIGRQLLYSDAILTGDLMGNMMVERKPISVDGSLVY